MIDQHSSLEEIFSHVWQMLQRGGSEADNPLRFPVLATYGAEGIQQRMVVLRKFDQAASSLICYTDFRSGKVNDIKRTQEAHWLFYDPEANEQIRVKTQTILHHKNEVASRIWNDIPVKARKDYLGPAAPGTVSEKYTTNLPEFALNDNLNDDNTAYGFDNFCVIAGKVTHLEFLAIRKSGHIRASFSKESNNWHKQWIAP